MALQGNASLSGAPNRPEQNTEVRMIWDRTAIYAHFHCLDRCIWGRCEKHHDAIFEEEAVELFLNPEDRLERYYEFALSPWGIRYGSLVRNEGGNPPIVRVVHYMNAQEIGGRVAIRGGGGVPFRSTRPPTGQNSLHESWTAFIRIPFSLFERPAPRPGESWKANPARINRDGLAELSCWSPNSMHPKSFHHPGTFGVIQFVKRLPL